MVLVVVLLFDGGWLMVMVCRMLSVVVCCCRGLLSVVCYLWLYVGDACCYRFLHVVAVGVFFFCFFYYYFFLLRVDYCCCCLSVGGGFVCVGSMCWLDCWLLIDGCCLRCVVC